jgi:DNA invertase Pin-like site-specific DNA recombinase
MRIGYARVSTPDQNPQLQIDALEAAGVDEVVVEKGSGKNRNRPSLEALLARLREGDTLVVWKLDRLGRSVTDLENIVVKELGQRGVAFVSLTDGFDTTTNGGRLLFHILGAVAEFERDLIAERVARGRAIARKNGKAGGRRRSLSEADEDQLLELWNTTSVRTLADRFKADRATIYRAKARAQQRQEQHGKR